MIRPSDIRDYLAAAGVTAPILEGFDEGAADRAVFVTPTGGPGMTHELVFDQEALQVLTRGARGDLDDAMALADQVDRAFVDASFPVTIAGRHVPRIQRFGGAPAAVHRDDKRRSIMSATYVVSISRWIP